MNSGQTAERVYDAIRRRIAERAFRPGDRLDPAHLARDLNSSVTPVRDALHLLTGERLVETRVGDGFHLPHIDAPALEDMYVWNLEVLGLAIKSWAKRPSQAAAAAAPLDVADAAAALFTGIAAHSSNAEHPRAIGSLNDRFRAIRAAEASVISDWKEEFAQLLAAFGSGTIAELRTGLTRYHRRRRRLAADIVRALYRPE